MAPFIMLAASALLGSVSAATEQMKNWGKNIHWVSFKEGQRIAREQKKPAMVVIHKSWCRACKALRPRFANSSEIEAMSNEFIMINVEDDDEPRGAEYKPDGAYIPRILFLGTDGQVLDNVYNGKGNPRYKHYYSEPFNIVESMKQVLRMTAGRNPSLKGREL
ncbi:thioredoxin domain-containing protein 12 [Plakobranchus ocellatus]|uniref:Thioredoxin domain-containing protein 12 n=1 Tax=Plakobranchus ocellatus TaxID=259542 RepID=A0AAV4DUZ3_9GAST|nr:thioredoxin domain-containing protein 12 [Plakobranchus ocellatus]